LEKDLAKKKGAPPAHLSSEAKVIWRDVVDLVGETGVHPLRVVCEAYDRLQDARRLIDKEGVTYTTKTGFKREHPALKIEKEARTGFLAAWRLLKLGDVDPVGRPPQKRKFDWLNDSSK
jgi:P27 family predicted phage terminase small subunit